MTVLRTLFFYKKGMTALHIAAEQGQLEAMNMLIEGRADIEEKDNDGKTALMHAVIPYNNGHKKSDHKTPHLMIEMINKLVECGANINAKDNNGMTALMHAAKHCASSREVVERLIALGAIIESL
jgi:serine/threonine-protein phosphatase 6 regulatory ankyrin repeat subunit A/serine/threonine-protein phosphatase 6 regulatory ankyrin repeat subunit B